MALTDTDTGTGTYVLKCSMLDTTTTFGSGKTNTQTLMGKLNSRLKEKIQPKVNKGWFIPSKEEWSAFGGELGITTSNYSAKGLRSLYWSSSQYITGTDRAWLTNFKDGFMYYDNNIDYFGGYFRLATTF